MNAHIKKFLSCKHHNVQQFTEYCFDCGENRYTTIEEIMKKEGVTNMNTKSKNQYDQPEAFWEVTTEGDCEGRSVRNLGVHFGFLDDIAFALADKCYYSLRFKLVEPFDVSVPTATKVNISLDIDSGTWDMSASRRQQFFANLLNGRDVAVKEGQSYASVELIKGKTELERKEYEKAMLKKQALAKLSPEERELLGF